MGRESNGVAVNHQDLVQGDAGGWRIELGCQHMHALQGLVRRHAAFPERINHERDFRDRIDFLVHADLDHGAPGRVVRTDANYTAFPTSGLWK
jgi:hypothetical protein